MPQSSLILPPEPKLQDFQKYIAKMIKVRGFSNETIPEIFMMLLEECGELAKAARKYTNIHIDATSERFEVEDEVADVFMYLLDICNHFDIDLETGFRRKEEKNMKRVWK